MKRLIFFASVCLMLSATSFGQGVQTGTIRGTVRDQQELAIPGATVTATSDALQGARESVTDILGNYTIPALPAGEYQMRFELSGFGPLVRVVTVPLGLVVEQNVLMSAAGV